MTKLKIEVSKKSRTLALHIMKPLYTVKQLINFFEEKKIIVDSMILMNEHKASILLLHLIMEPHAIDENIALIKSMPGILSMDDDKTPEKSIVRVLAPFLRKKY